MAFNIESLDDEPVVDSCPSFAGGMVSNATIANLRADQAALLQNFDVQQSGTLATRLGSFRLGAGNVTAPGAPYAGGTLVTGLEMFNTPTYSYLVAANNRYLWKWNGTAWALLDTGTYHANASHTTVQMVQGADKLYIADGYSNLYSWDGVTMTNLGGGGAAQPPVGPSAIVWHTNRLIAAGMTAAPDTVAFSDILDGATWDTSLQNLRPGAGDGDVVTGLCPWLDFNLIVIKRASLWVINCDPTLDVADMPIKCIHPAIGSSAPNTFVQVGSDVFGLTTSGVRSMRRTFAAETQSELGPSVSFPIDNLMDRINRAALSTAVATYWNNRYILSVPMDGATRPNYVLVYNTITESWSGYWTGWNATCFAGNIVSGTRYLAFGRNGGAVYQWSEKIYPLEAVTAAYFADEDVAYDCQYISRILDFGEARSKKTGFNVELELGALSEMDMTLSGYFDRATVSPVDPSPYPVDDVGPILGTLDADAPESVFRRNAFDLQAQGQFRGVQLELRGFGGIALRRITATAFIDTVELQTA